MDPSNSNDGDQPSLLSLLTTVAVENENVAANSSNSNNHNTNINGGPGLSLPTALPDTSPRLGDAPAKRPANHDFNDNDDDNDRHRHRHKLKYDPCYDPLPYRVPNGADRDDEASRDEGPRVFGPSPFRRDHHQQHQQQRYDSSREQAVVEESLETHDVGIGEPYPLFSRQYGDQASHPQLRLQLAKTGDGLEERPPGWQPQQLQQQQEQRQEQERIDSAIDATDNSMDLEPSPVWPNEAAYAIKAREGQRPGSLTNRSMMNDDSDDAGGKVNGNVGDDDDDDDDSNPIPLQRGFHPVPHQQELTEFGVEKQGLLPMLEIPPQQQQRTLLATDITSPLATNDEGGVAPGGFPEGAYKPPPPQQPQQVPQIPANQPPQPLPANHSDFSYPSPHFSPGQEEPRHRMSLTLHGRESLPAPQMTTERGSTPIPSSFEANHGGVFADDPGPRIFEGGQAAAAATGNPIHFEAIAGEDRYLPPRDRFEDPPALRTDRKRPRNHRTDGSGGAAPRKGPASGSSRTICGVPPEEARTKWTGGDTYVGRIHTMLEEARGNGFAHVVSWQPHGRAFKIHKREEFAERILPRYFHTKNMKHFQRWLSAWGFARHGEGTDRGAYYHRYFVRGVVVALVKKLTRAEMRRSMKDWLAPGEVPNFYTEKDSTPCRSKSSKIGMQPAFEGATGREKDDRHHHQEQHAKGNEPGDDKNDEPGISNERGSVVLHNNPKYLRGTVLKDVRRMLEDARTQHFAHVVSWLPGGRAFKIHNKKSFQESVCGRYMKTAKLSYFSDCLRTWGFCRLKEAAGEEQNAYYHRLFRDGKPELYRHLSRAQMLEAMKDFKEEQKRQKEISWSLFPHHRQNFGINGNENDAVANSMKLQPVSKEAARKANPEELALATATAAERLADRAEVENEIKAIGEPLHLVQAAFANPLSQPQDFLTGYLDVHNGNKEDARSATNPHNSNAMDMSMRNRFIDNCDLDPTYQSVHPSTATEVFAPDARRPLAAPGDPRTASIVCQTPKPTLLPSPMARTANLSYAMRIHAMLEEVEAKGRTDIVSWMPHGRAFKIHDDRAFETKILPQYFKATLPSFTRWLLHWGFVRMITGKDRKCWYHRLFVRGVVELIRDHTRQELFDAMKEWRDQGNEPDFYSSGTGEEISEMPMVAKKKHTRSDKENNSIDETESEPIPTIAAREQKTNPRILRGTVVENLREMLDSAQAEGNAHIVSWLAHGKAFKIHNQDEFEANIMGQYFKASKYRYFTDVLRSWGFVKLKEGRDKGAYHHKYFAKNDPKLSHNLSRAQMKASMKGWPKQNVPSFYDENKP